MRKIFEAELQGVGDDLLAMSQAVEQAITNAGAALLTADNRLAQVVIAEDAAIDKMQRALDERIVYVLAQQAPVARDLRTLVAALRLSATLERMGDLAKHVAEAARKAYPEKALRPSMEQTFAKMIDAAIRAAKETTKLIRTHDLEIAEAIGRDDQVLDDLLIESYSELLSPDWDGTAQEAVDITLLGRFLERFGDHATSIARRITFLVTGDISKGVSHI
jgi:phosphate transport system protein